MLDRDCEQIVVSTEHTITRCLDTGDRITLETLGAGERTAISLTFAQWDDVHRFVEVRKARRVGLVVHLGKERC